MLRPAAQRLLDALTAARFVNPRLSIDNYDWGFRLAGHVMATAWRGEVELVLSIPPAGARDDITADCQYVAASNEGGKSKEEVLWRVTLMFPPGGVIEHEEMRRLVDGMNASLRPSVKRVLDIAEGRA